MVKSYSNSDHKAHYDRSLHRIETFLNQLNAICDDKDFKKALTETISALHNQIQNYKEKNNFDEKNIVKYLSFVIETIISNELIQTIGFDNKLVNDALSTNTISKLTECLKYLNKLGTANFAGTIFLATSSILIITDFLNDLISEKPLSIAIINFNNVLQVKIKQFDFDLNSDDF